MSSCHKVVHVAVAVIENPDGQFLIAKRPQHLHQGGLWEFPGGKVERGETVFDALKRELFEEVGLSISHALPLICIPHDYADKTVLLDVWSVGGFTGSAFAKEGQEICWIDKTDFSLYEFPLANNSIIKAIQLPDKYMITGDFENAKELLLYVQSGLERGIKLIQLRAPDLVEALYFDYAEKIYSLCSAFDAKLLLNTSLVNYKKYLANSFSHGIHLNSKEIINFSDVDFFHGLLVATSIHNCEELFLAQNKKVDFCVLSPVNKTISHPGSNPLGWQAFQQLTEKAKVPVYALGGMTEDDLVRAKNHGAQGISAIGEFWRV
jgi:8-oxo-dGTP diphosphatase